MFAWISVELSSKSETDTRVQRGCFGGLHNDSHQVLYAWENTTAGTPIFITQRTKYFFLFLSSYVFIIALLHYRGKQHRVYEKLLNKRSICTYKKQQLFYGYFTG